jgi:hypothetical protein
VASLLGGGRFDSGLLASWIEGDSNYDGIVDVLDIADFLTTGLFDAGSYNPPVPGSSAPIATVPEPTGVGLAVIGLILAGTTLRRGVRRLGRELRSRP